jgi:predicted amidohydrolase
MTKRKPGPRVATVGTCTLNPSNVPGGDKERFANGIAAFDAMVAEAEGRGWQLDMVVLPETFAQVEPEVPLDSAEPIDGRIVSTFAEKARRAGTHAAIPVILREDDRAYNACVIAGRDGQVVGVYRKVFPVLVLDGTLESGIAPGDEFPVFDLDFGRVGIQICFDVFFEPGWQALDEQEAELVLFTSATPAVAGIKSHAYRHEYYVAASTFVPPTVVVDPLGREVGRTANDKEVLVVQMDLDYRVVPWNSLRDWGKAMEAKYGGRIRQDWHMEEQTCLATSLDPELPVGRWMEIEGLETRREHLARNVPVQDAARGGPPPETGG